MPIDLSTKNALIFPLKPRTLTIGRDPSCDIRLKGVGVSRFHARLHLAADKATIEDLENSSGILLDGRLVHQEPVSSGSILTIGVNKLSMTISASFLIISQIHEPEYSPALPDSVSPDVITIGRDCGNSLHLSHPLVSRFHAVARRSVTGGFSIEDLGSTNGTFVNGKPVRRTQIADGDIVHVGPYRFYCHEGKFHQAQDFNKIRLEAFNLTVAQKKRLLLDDVSLSVSPGEFIAVLGPSGSGKTTLARTLMGQTLLRDGAIFYNGLPIKTFFSAFHSLIGFVTQENLLRPELTVRETFFEQSLLRLPRDSVPAEHHERIRAVTDLLGLSALTDRRIANLSGGEAKRVHFGIELLSSPTIIFFDEPFAGLDPGLIQKFMALFRSFCDKGHTLLLTTHTLEQIDSCNRVLFMDKGRLLFSGTPQELAATYGIRSLPEMYEKVKEISPQPAVRSDFRGKGSPLSRYKSAPVPEGKLYRSKTISPLRQLAMLISRYAKITVRDRKNLLLFLIQAPLIALVLMCTYQADLGAFPVSFYFCLSISAIWMGGMNSIREIAREWPVIERELRAGLSPSVYCLSKIIVFGFSGMVQALLFGCCLDVLFPAFSMNAAVALLLSVACVSGVFVGLCMSVFSKNVNMAISWLPIIFIPQIFFSGILVPFDEMSAVGRMLSYLTVSRYVFSLFKKNFFLDQPLWPNWEWNALFLLCIGLIILMIAWIGLRRRIVQNR
jgi:ABC transport system ATP-binding/permease protein